MGICRGRSPLTVERSEWHRLAALICTSTSRWPGLSSSTSSMLIGLLSAYGCGRPICLITAAFIFIVYTFESSPQRHRDTEKGKTGKLICANFPATRVTPKLSCPLILPSLGFGFPLCLCVSVVNGLG